MTPARLHKVEDNEVTFMDIHEKIEGVLLRYGHILIPLIVILALIGFVAICFLICGASATESGLQYNQMENIVNNSY
jgi:hypothetical protein